MFLNAFVNFQRATALARGTTAAASFIFALLTVAVQAQTWDTLHESQVAVWVTPAYNLAACNTYKTDIDSVAAELDLAIPLIVQYLGIAPPEKPQRVQIDSGCGGGCMGGWSSGGDVGYAVSDFFGRPQTGDGLRWIRGVIIGEVINSTTGAVSDNWPRDWWSDDVWYFPGFVAGELLKQVVDSTFGNYWLTSEKYPTYPVYNTFVSLKDQFGWAFYKTFFSTVLADSMKWSKIGANPSQIKSDYVIAYFGLAAGKNMGSIFLADKVNNVDTAEVAAIMDVEKRLVLATKSKLNVATAWSDYRNGNYAGANTILNQLGVDVRYVATLANPPNDFGTPRSVTLYSITGQKLYDGYVNGIHAIGLRAQQSVIASYNYGNGAVSVKKLLLTR